MANFQPVSPGDPLNIGAEEWNALLGLLQQGRPLQGPHLRTLLRHTATLRVRNDCGRPLQQFGVAGLVGPRIGPDADLDRFRRDHRHLRVVLPVEPLHFGRFVVALEPIPEGAFGTAVLSGFVPVRVLVTDRRHGWADVLGGQVQALRSCRAGAAQILWLQRPGQLGLQWALVRLSNAAWQLWKLSSCDDPDRILYTTADLSQYDGKAVRLKGQRGCWLVQFVPCDSPGCFDPQCVEVVGVHDQCADCRDCWKLTDCADSSNVKYTGVDLSFYDGKVVKLQGDPGTCWQVAREKQNCSNLVDVAVEEEFDQCSDCTCWKLTNCHDETHELWTTSNLARQLGTTADQAKGRIVELLEYAGCWRVADYGSQYCSAQAVPVTVKNEREDCSCPCLVLTDCSNSSNTKLVTQAVNTAGKVIDLEQYVGQVVRDSNGTCWQVSRLTDPAQCSQHPPGSITVLEAYDDCTACQNLVKLRQCGTTTEIVTYSDLSPWGAVAVGNVYVRDDGTCWEVTQVGGLSWTGNEEDFYAVGTAVGCTSCSQNYKLVVDCYTSGCQDPAKLPADRVVQDPRLARVVGGYIKWDGYCWKVSTTTDAVTHTLGEFQGLFPTCVDCLSAPLSVTKNVLVGACEDSATGKNRFVVERWRFVDGRLVESCSDNCLDPPVCSTECDTGSGGSGGGGGGGGGSNNCSCSGMPNQLTLTITTGMNACSCWQGKTTTLTWDSSKNGWTGLMNDANCGVLEFFLECAAAGVHPALKYNCDGGGLFFDSFDPLALDCAGKRITYVKTLPAGCCDMGVGGYVELEVTW